MFSEPAGSRGQVRILIIYLIIINKFQITLCVFSILRGAHKLKHSVLPGHLLFLLDWSVKFLFSPLDDIVQGFAGRL